MHPSAIPASPDRNRRRAGWLAAATIIVANFATLANAADADPRYRAGLGLLNRDLHAEAAAELAAFIESSAAATGTEVDSTELATARYSLALCHAKLGRPVDAAMELDRMRAPLGFAFAADALFLHGQCAASIGDHSAAAGSFGALKRDHPTFARLDRVTALLGESLLRAGRTAEALTELRLVQQRWPQFAGRDRVDLLCATAEIATNDDSAAAERLASLRARDPRGTFAHQATVLEAQCRRRLGQFEPALALHDAALAELAGKSPMAAADQPSSPTRAELLLGRAACLRALARHDECIEACEACIARVNEARATAPAGVGGSFTSPDVGPVTAAGAEQFLVAARLMLNHARFESGRVLLEQGRGEEGQRVLEQLVAEEVRGATAEEAGEQRELRVAALRALSASAARAERLVDSAAFLGRIAATAGLPAVDRAAALADQGATLAAASRDREAEQVFDQFLATAADHPRAREVTMRRAMAIARQGRHQQAIAAFEDAFPNDNVALEGAAPLDVGLRSAAIFEHGSALNAVGRTAEGSERLRELLGPATPAALRGRAAVELSRLAFDREGIDDHRAALALLDQVVLARGEASAGELDDVRETELFMRGACQLRLGDASTAAATLASFERDFPASDLRFPAALHRADALLATDEPAAAATVLQDVAASTTECAIVAPALLRLGDASARAEQWGRSQQAFERFIALPADCEAAGRLWHQARFGVGLALERQGKFVEAIEAYRDVAARHRGPTAARAQFQVGECLFAEGRLDAAVRELMKVDVLFAEPQWSAAALCEAGRCLVELGRGADAKAQFDAVVERFPESPWAKVARERRDEIRPAALPGREAASRAP